MSKPDAPLLILFKGETLAQSIMKDSVTLLSQLILLTVALKFDLTGWTIFASIMFMFFLVLRSTRNDRIRCKNYQDAFTKINEFYGESK